MNRTINMNQKYTRLADNIYSIRMHENLRLDGLILNVRRGFNPLSADFADYNQHPNEKLKDTTVVYEYNVNGRPCPSPEELTRLIHKDLDTLTRRGCRRIALNPLWYRDENGDRKGGAEADRLNDEAVQSWLALEGNSSKVDMIFIVDRYCRCQSSAEYMLEERNVQRDSRD